MSEQIHKIDGETAAVNAPEKNPEKKKKKAKKYEITVKANKKGRHIMPFLNFFRVLVIPIYYLLKPFRFYGPKKVKDGPCVYVCNHYGMFDPIFPAVTTSEGIHFIAKKELFSKPVVSWAIRKIKGIAANRDGNDVRVVMDSFKCLKNGEKIAIFPEGTRNKTGVDMLPFHHGAAIISIKTKAPIVPIMIYKKPRFFRMTHVLIGEPFELTEYYDRKLTEQEMLDADEKIRQIMLNMRAKHREWLDNKKKKKGKNA